MKLSYNFLGNQKDLFSQTFGSFPGIQYLLFLKQSVAFSNSNSALKCALPVDQQ